MRISKLSSYYFLLMAVLLTAACGGQQKESAVTATGGAAANDLPKLALEVHKSPTCGCCGEWVDHLKERGFVTKVHDTDEMDALKEKWNIKPQLQSCHTAVSADGYVFEGHIPAKYVRRFLDEKPANAIGLTVPGMPVGSPGMEMGETFHPYDILLLKDDGSTEVYASVSKAADQF